jgi:glycosyltransferase involved in cell wall biosynthesis
LTIAGDGDPGYIARLKAFARLLRVAEYVRWIGYVEGEKKREVFAGASAFVLPSFSENFGIAVAEALAAGLPCLVSRRVALSDQVEKAGAGVVVNTTPQDIAAGLERLMQDGVGLLEKSLTARTLAIKEFSLDTMGARLEALYRRILDLKHEGKIEVAS